MRRNFFSLGPCYIYFFILFPHDSINLNNIPNVFRYLYGITHLITKTTPITQKMWLYTRNIGGKAADFAVKVFESDAASTAAFNSAKTSFEVELYANTDPCSTSNSSTCSAPVCTQLCQFFHAYAVQY